MTVSEPEPKSNCGVSEITSGQYTMTPILRLRRPNHALVTGGPGHHNLTLWTLRHPGHTVHGHPRPGCMSPHDFHAFLVRLSVGCCFGS